jgi:BCD family chlorophyll transporter-like MFS transporter
MAKTPGLAVRRVQLGLVHLAVAATLVPINSTLNRVMIKELGLSALLVAAFASLPYLFSPLQVAIGSYTDRRPLLGLHRTPYVLLGLVLCAGGLLLSPYAAFLLVRRPVTGVLLAVLAFGLWGTGYNLATVCYLSLATELSPSGEGQRGRTVSVMWIMMILGIIATAVVLSGLLESYDEAVLKRAFAAVALVALLVGSAALIRLEPKSPGRSPERHSWTTLFREARAGGPTRRFFLYLVVLLIAVLGQDVLLEPYAAEAFGIAVSATTRITAIWGGCVLGALAVGGVLERRVRKGSIARTGAWTAAVGFLLLILAPWAGGLRAFYPGLLLLGIGTGLSTESNLSLMLDMTVPGKVGLYMGIWGMASAVARMVGALASGLVRDAGALLLGDPVPGYTAAFSLLLALLLASLRILGGIDVAEFARQAKADP